jgi:hypothetical protein
MPRRDSNPNLSRRAAADPCLRLRDLWNRLKRTLPSLCLQIRVKIKVKFCLSQPCKHTRRAEIQLHLFLTSVLDEDGWLASRPGRFASMERAPGSFELEAEYASVSFWEEKCLLFLSGIEACTVRPLARKTTLLRLHRYVLTSELSIVPTATFSLI